jgi:hypothetical protein
MKRSKTLNGLRSRLMPGQVYRRSDFVGQSTNVDRHLAALVTEGSLKKLARGLYVAPKQTSFGEGAPNEESLLESFLKDDHFVVYSFNQFNALGLGTTQLYNRRVVFNRKRVGEFSMGGRKYVFHRWREAPRKLTQEFLVVELLNRLDDLAEDRNQVLEKLKAKLQHFDSKSLKFHVAHFGTMACQNRYKALTTEAA